MNDAIKATEKKVHYVLSYIGAFTGNRYYVSVSVGGGTYVGSPRITDAIRFESIGAIMQSKALAWLGCAKPSVVRVEETPNTEALRVTSRDIIDVRKPTVIYWPLDQTYAKAAEDGVLEPVSLQDATVFADVADLLGAVGRNAEVPAEPDDEFVEFHIHQVERVPAAVTRTETVLA